MESQFGLTHNNTGAHFDPESSKMEFFFGPTHIIGAHFHRTQIIISRYGDTEGSIREETKGSRYEDTDNSKYCVIKISRY